MTKKEEPGDNKIDWSQLILQILLLENYIFNYYFV